MYSGQTTTTKAPRFVLIGFMMVMFIGVLTSVLVFSQPRRPPPPPVIPTSITITQTGPNVPPVPVTSPTEVDPAAAMAGPQMFIGKCNAGDGAACVAAGAMFEHGGAGFPADRAKARAMYDRACSLGNAGGCHMRDMLKK